MADVPVSGTHPVEVTAEDGTVSTAELELRFARARVLPPVWRRKLYPALDLTIPRAIAAGDPTR